jgi:hypothetical protein
VVADRRTGRVIVGEFARSSGAFLLVWTLYALGVAGSTAFNPAVLGMLVRRSAEPR